MSVVSTFKSEIHTLNLILAASTLQAHGQATHVQTCTHMHVACEHTFLVAVQKRESLQCLAQALSSVRIPLKPLVSSVEG